MNSQRPLLTNRSAMGVASLAATALLVAGCANPFAEATSEDAIGQPAGSSQTVSGFPVTIENCGEEVTFEEPPERVFAYYQHPAETLLALGLGDSIVGYAYPDNAPLADYADAYEALPLVSEQGASFEQVIKTEPDLVYGGYSSSFAEAEGRSRQSYADAGIETYLDRESCSDAATTIDQLYDEITTLGEIFGVQDRAEELAVDLQDEIEETQEKLVDIDPVSVFVYDSGDDAPFTVGGAGMGDQVIALAGGENLFGDVGKNFADVSWEQVAKERPEVIVILDYFGTPSVEKKKQLLLDRPELADVPAIENRRFATLTLQATLLGIRAPLAVSDLAGQLHPDAVS